jgi:PRTRC genetic system protein C
MIDAKGMSRSFTYNGMKLPDPDSRTPEEVKAIYSNQYPELATAATTGPEASGEQCTIGRQMTTFYCTDPPSEGDSSNFTKSTSPAAGDAASAVQIICLANKESLSRIADKSLLNPRLLNRVAFALCLLETGLRMCPSEKSRHSDPVLN